MIHTSSNRPRFCITGIVLMVVLSTTTAAATGTQSLQGEAVRSVVDGLGRRVEIPEYPERIVVAGAASLMVADALYMFASAPERIVGITRIAQARGNFLPAIDPNYNDKAVLERNVGPEQVAALSPDVVFLKSFMKQRLGDGIERLGIPVIYLDLETPEQYRRDIRILGDVLGEPARADALVGYFQAVVEAVEQRTRTLDDEKRPEVLFLYANPTGGDVAFNIPPQSWIQTMLVETSGGKPVWSEANTGGGWTAVGFEQIAAWNPDKIFLVAYRDNPEMIRDQLLQQDTWQALAASQNNEFYVFPVDYYSWDQPDPRWALGLQWLASRMHPEIFEDINLRQVVYTFFDEVFNMSRADTDRIILADLWGSID